MTEPLGLANFDPVPLKRLFRVVNGGTPPADDRFWGGDVTWVTPGDLASRDGTVITTSARTLTTDGLACGSALVPEGSLILSTRAPIGYVVRAGTELSTNQGCKSLVPRVSMEPQFFQYVLGAARPALQASGNGTTFMELSTVALGSIRLPVPSLAEQRRIADYLDAESAQVDELIAEQEHLVVLLLERREAELDGWIEHGGCQTALREVSSPWVDAVPPGWELTPLKRCAERVMVGIVINPSAYYEAEGVPVLRGLNVRPGRVSSDDLVFMSAESNELHRKSILHAGDIVVVRTGTAGSAAQVPSWAVGGNAVDLLIVRPGDRLVPGFLEHVLNSRVVQRQVHYGSVGALQSHFNTASLANVVVPLPPLGDQLRVLEHLRRSLGRYDALIAEVRMQIRHLRERRQTLITTAVTQGIDGLPRAA